MRTAIRSAGRSDALAGVVVSLDDRSALDPVVVGAKAAALARAAWAGLPVLPGRVLTTSAGTAGGDGEVDAELRSAWSTLSEDGLVPVVVRSSSTVEDGRTSSMAGMFTSVLDVGDWDRFRLAVDAVLESGRVVAMAAAEARERARAAMAVLVQPQLSVAVGGVMFGVDPVSGADRLVISASAAGPSAVVSGEVDGTRYAVSGRRVVEGPGDAGGPLTHVQVRQLARLGRHAERVFGGPQDVEWAFDLEGRLWLLQSRPVTTTAGPAGGRGPVLGPGPVAETFPDPLSPLEQDLWVPPLREGLRSALSLAGTATPRQLARSPIVTVVGGRVAADLALLGVDAGTPSLLRRLDPRPPVRRLVAAWRVGRLRAALPSLADDLVASADADLLAVGALEQLSDGELLGLLRRSAQALTALHGHEVLMGWLIAPTATAPAATTAPTAASVALRALAAARAGGLTDDEIVSRHPTVLALVPPRIDAAPSLPPTVDGLTAPASPSGTDTDRAAVLREALRLRARWVQELTARAAWELGARLAERGVVADAGSVRGLRLDELAAAVATGARPDAAGGRQAPRADAPLPARFRLTAGGAVVPERVDAQARHAGGGVGAGGGRGVGPVHGGDGTPEPGAVLVVRTLDPGLAPVLPRLGGLVAETGSFLSHLAILAREFGVPTVVGVEGAIDRFPPGSVIVVDGATGEVTAAEVGERGAA